MKKVLIEELHAYLMEDGEIIICEQITEESIYWSSSLGEGIVKSPLKAFLIGEPLGYIGEDQLTFNRVELDLF